MVVAASCSVSLCISVYRCNHKTLIRQFERVSNVTSITLHCWAQVNHRCIRLYLYICIQHTHTRKRLALAKSWWWRCLSLYANLQWHTTNNVDLNPSNESTFHFDGAPYNHHHHHKLSLKMLTTTKTTISWQLLFITSYSVKINQL